MAIATYVAFTSGFFKFNAESSHSTVYTPKLVEDKLSLDTSVVKGLEYLAKVQFENGGWGAGTHANQRMIDATQVQIDPATTAFAGLALLRAGNTLQKGAYKRNLGRSLDLLLNIVEASPKNSPAISNVTGTQPQVKLGRNVDASMCMQFFMRILPYTNDNPKLEGRVSEAIDICLNKIKLSQAEDGSIQGGGWAPVLQSAIANNALEMAYNDGRDVDKNLLSRSRAYQKENMDASGKVRSERGAGVDLYSIAGNQRATAVEARKAQKVMEKARKKGTIKEDAPMTIDNLVSSGEVSDEEAQVLYQAYEQNKTTVSKMQDDQVLTGFGNNGGEEFLSFMMSSESMVITGGEAWDKWKAKMNNMLTGIQNGDGSWNGHHCITSPVFCTAACILALTAEHDKDWLLKNQKEEEN